MQKQLIELHNHILFSVILNIQLSMSNIAYILKVLYITHINLSLFKGQNPKISHW